MFLKFSVDSVFHFDDRKPCSLFITPAQNYVKIRRKKIAIQHIELVAVCLKMNEICLLSLSSIFGVNRVFFFIFRLVRFPFTFDGMEGVTTTYPICPVFTNTGMVYRTIELFLPLMVLKMLLHPISCALSLCAPYLLIEYRWNVCFCAIAFIISQSMSPTPLALSTFHTRGERNFKSLFPYYNFYFGHITHGPHHQHKHSQHQLGNTVSKMLFDT